MLLAFVLAYFVSILYRRTHTGMGWEPSFLAVLVLLAPVVSLVMLFIQGDLVLSLGLVGSLSIIRFRTPIKDARDMVFLFWVIAIGLGSGTLYWTLTAAGTGLLMVLTVLLHFLHRRTRPRSDYVLVVSGLRTVTDTANVPTLDKLQEILRPLCQRMHLRSHEQSGDLWEAVWELQLQPDTDSSHVMETLNQFSPLERVSLLAPELSLPA